MTQKRELALKRLNPGRLASEERLEDDAELMNKLKNAYKPPNHFMKQRDSTTSSVGRTSESRYALKTKSKSTMPSQYSRFGDTNRY